MKFVTRLKFSLKRLKVFGVMLCMGLSSLSLSSWSADQDDLYSEVYGGVASNRSGRITFGGTVGYLPREELGIGFFLEEHVSRDLGSLDESGFRTGIEMRWFQEPFEFSGSLGIMKQQLRTGGSSNEPTIGFDASYLWALTPSIAALVRFNFLFLDSPGVIFYSGLGVRALF